MGTVTPVTPWIPKDDFLLKNAIEAGASLESLAKGAVRFSRRFTIKELQDRWYALLYDPVISAEASAQLVELERSSKPTKGDNSKEHKFGDGKRKADNVRRCYYAMRKRICNEPLYHEDLNFFDDPNDGFINGAEGPGPKSLPGDPMATHYELENGHHNDFHNVFPHVIDSAPPCGTANSTAEQNTLVDTLMAGSNVAMAGNCSITEHIGRSEEVPVPNIFQEQEGDTNFNPSISECETSLHHLQYASSPPTMPDWKGIEGISVPEMPNDGNIRENSMQTGDPFCITNEGGLDNPELNNPMSCNDLKDSTDCAEGYFAELSDSLFNFTSDDDMLIIGGGKDVMAKTYLDGLSSLLLNSPNDLNEGTMPGIPELEEQAVVDEGRVSSPTAVLEEKNSAGESEQQSNSEFQMPMHAGNVNPEYPELRNGIICCTLNTEDPEIPCNDHLSFSKPRAPSVIRRTQSDANKSAFSDKDSTTENKMKRETKRTGEPSPGLNRTLSVDKFGATFEGTKGESHNAQGDSGKSKSTMAVKNESLECPLKRQRTCKLLEKSGQVAAVSNAQTVCGGSNQESYALELADSFSVEPCEDSLFSEDEQSYESDSDIPHFSDVESMILDMDLDPDDEDFFYSTQVAKYQHEDAKRMIIRLEQNANSCMQRATASRGAFAILYGRHSKHYIKKQEVLIGRGTEDVPVDIDLGREGRANKISRRQAIIKMEKDGTFGLRNMGKCSIYVNSKEIYHGQTFALHSNCLIEIRGIPFIFEINPSLVKKYLDHTAQKTDVKMPKP